MTSLRQRKLKDRIPFKTSTNHVRAVVLDRLFSYSSRLYMLGERASIRHMFLGWTHEMLIGVLLFQRGENTMAKGQAKLEILTEAFGVKWTNSG